MFRIIRSVLLAILVLAVWTHPVRADWFSSDKETLLTVNDEDYTVSQYNNWWDNWREKDMQLPDTPDQFVDWVLLFQEAEKMNLFDDPGFQTKVLTFVKARSLMMLKNEEVDSKINITDDELWKRYEKDYIPKWMLNEIFFIRKESADSAYQKLINGTINEQMLEEMTPDEGGAKYIRSQVQRPKNTHEAWQAIIRDMKNNSFTEPIVWKDGYVILHLLHAMPAEKNDFESVKQGIQRKLYKEKEAELTSQLILRLQEKYNVEINKDRLREININDPNTTVTDEPLFTSSIGSLSEKEFMDQVRGQQVSRKKMGFVEDEKFDLKMRVINGIVSQTLTTREALDRHYEKKPPFEQVYQFYVQHRLIKVLEQQVFAPEVIVSEDDVKKYYEKHIQGFTHPEVFHLAVIVGSESELDKIWKEMAAGEDFMALAKEKEGHDAPVIELAADRMDPAAKKVVTRLSKGEVSQVVFINGQYSLLKLIKREPGSVDPLDQVRKQIFDKLWSDKFTVLRDDYISKLREAAQISVDEKVWKKTRKEIMQNEKEAS